MLIPIILCGGAGSRLWPVSRELHPKPFMRLADGESLLQKAFLRGANLPDVAEIFTIGSRDLFFKIQDEYRPVNPGNLATRFILEPLGRNTAAAVAAAALDAERRHGGEARLLVLAADHLIQNGSAFAAAVAQASDLAGQGLLVTFGITPLAPETGYGYIEADGHQVRRFVEKPSLDKAREYVASGNYLWNAGIFCFTARAILDELQEHAPDILQGVRDCLDHAHQASGDSFTQVEFDAQQFSTVREDSIDFAVMEKSAHVAVVPCDIGWSDIGSWAAVSELHPADADGNRTEGEVLLQDTHDCYIQAGGRLVATLGVQGLVIVDTPDALLVATRQRSQEVKHLYARLKTEGHESHRLHRTVHRPWGTYTVLEEGPGFKIKRIEVKPGASLSLQMHHHRSEHWVVVSGTAIVTNGEQEIMVQTNQSTYIPAGNRHRLRNPGLLDLVMIEVQSGQYLGEDDIVRFEDVYGRT